MIDFAQDKGVAPWELMLLAWVAGALTALCLIQVWRRPATLTDQVFWSIFLLVPFLGPILFALFVGTRLSDIQDFFGTIRSALKANGSRFLDEYANRFTPMAQQAFTNAQGEATRLNHHFLGTEHLLLGLLQMKQGVAASVLRNMGLDSDKIRTEVEGLVGSGTGPKPTGSVPVTPRVKKVLSLSAKEARTLNHAYIGTEHLLLGLFGEPEGVAARVLQKFAVTAEQTRAEILKELDPSFQADMPGKSTAASKEITSEFTPRAQQALALARKEADKLNHQFVGTEHVLLGLTKLGQGGGVAVLQKAGLDLRAIRVKVEELIGTGPEPNATGFVPYTPRVKKALSLAVQEAEANHSPRVDTEHLLMGLLLEGGGVAARVLRQIGLTIERARQTVSELATTNSAATAWTPQARRVLFLARQEADRLEQRLVGTEHLLLGLIRSKQGTALDVLRRRGLDLNSLRTELETMGGKGQDLEQNGDYTTGAEKALSVAAQEAKALKHKCVDTEHILLGLLGEGQGVAARVLAKLNVQINQTRQQILRELDPGFAEPPPNLTPAARQVVALARTEAEQLHHGLMGVEHVMLGLLGMSDGVAVQLLHEMGLTLENVRKAVRDLTKVRSVIAERVRMPPHRVRVKLRLKRFWWAAATEAGFHDQADIDPDLLALALLGDNDDVVVGVFRNLKVDTEQTRREILRRRARFRTSL
jgi:ATP-dependent Clp protease ATP-binding subunit ClpA